MKYVIATMLVLVSVSSFAWYSDRTQTTNVRDNAENTYGDGTHRDGIADSLYENNTGRVKESRYY